MSNPFDKKKWEGLPSQVLEQLCAMKWEDLEEMADGSLLFPAVIQKRKKDGTFESIPVRIKVPREKDLRQARVKAREIARKEGLDLELDKDLFENLQTICILSIVIRSADTPEPFEPYPEQFEEHYDRASIMALYDLSERYAELVNPRPNSISEAEMWLLVARISEARNICPLAVYEPDAVSSFIIGMVDRLQTLQAQKSSSESSAPLTPE